MLLSGTTEMTRIPVNYLVSKLELQLALHWGVHGSNGFVEVLQLPTVKTMPP